MNQNENTTKPAPEDRDGSQDCCSTLMPRDMRDADTIARLERRVQNLFLVIKEGDNIKTAAFERAEDDAARLDLLQTSVDRDAFNLEGWREILHVFTGDVEGFGRCLYERQQLVLKGLEGLMVFIQPLADHDEGAVHRASIQMLTLIKRAAEGFKTELPAMPVHTTDSGYDINAIAEWSKFIADEEEKLQRAKQAAWRVNRYPMPPVLAWCPACKRHVAPEDHVTMAGERGDYGAHRDCGTPLEFHEGSPGNF